MGADAAECCVRDWKQHMCMDALPFCKVTLQRKRCPWGIYFRQVKGYPTTPKTIGERLRKRRLDLNLRQLDVADLIGCHETTVVNWEKNHSEPRITYLAAVVAFLGYDPFVAQPEKPTGKAPEDLLWATRLLSWRKARGLTQRQLAQTLQIDPSTVAKWERGERKPTGTFLMRVEALLE
jgi:transcriptional regulator with XRE-family HTH domain